jgi:two-component sensor histidine kinase
MAKSPEQWLPNLRAQPAAAYATAVLLGGAAILAEAADDGQLITNPFIFVYPAVILASFISGFGPGVVTALLGAAGAVYFVLPPAGSAAVQRPVDWIATAIYLATTMLVALGFDRLRRSVEENRGLAEGRRVLLLELQHRVKNHIQLVSALLAVQAREAANPEIKDGLASARRRIMAVGSAYSNLYTPGTTVEFAGHLRRIARELESAFARPGLKMEVDAVEMPMNMDLLVPLTLIAGELITNTFRHAKIGPGSPPILIRFHTAGAKTYKLAVVAHGELPEDFTLETHSGLGLKIVAQLTRQIGATFAFDRKPVSFFVTFPMR